MPKGRCPICTSLHNVEVALEILPERPPDGYQITCVRDDDHHWETVEQFRAWCEANVAKLKAEAAGALTRRGAGGPSLSDQVNSEDHDGSPDDWGDYMAEMEEARTKFVKNSRFDPRVTEDDLQ